VLEAHHESEGLVGLDFRLGAHPSALTNHECPQSVIEG